jgi:hypothetical protein
MPVKRVSNAMPISTKQKTAPDGPEKMDRFYL